MYLRPTRIEEALAALAAAPYTIIAGGTDYYPARVGRATEEALLDVTGLAELRGMREEPDRYRVGAAVRWTEIAEAPLPPFLHSLQLAAREIGGRQIQNAGTLAGNICNASPAADGVPCLLALDAEIELASARTVRRLPIADFVRGNRTTALATDELVTAILLPKPRGAARSTFLKLGSRRYLVISIVMVAALLECDDSGRIRSAGIAVGSCSAAARRLAALERALEGKGLAPGLGGIAGPQHLEPLSPIDDVRGTAAYRRDAAATLIARALDRLVEEGVA
jgi:CO/xanthine dehydrogenase FAD-binding subunit